jgi:phosphatidylglycerol:prolipoprotein diacylglycerol transferase
VLLAESYVHHIDPWVLRFTDGFGIRWYGVAYLAGFLVGWLLLRWLARTGRSLLTPVQVGDFVTFIVLGVLLGGRLGHVLLYDRWLLWEFSSAPPWWGLLAINRGGMSSHGGIIGVMVACVWYGHQRGVSIWHLLDLVAFACPAGLGLGRVANFINGELWGRPLPESMRADPPWWSIKYPEEILGSDFDATRLSPLEGLVSRPSSGGGSLAVSLVQAAQSGRAVVLERLAPLLTPHWPSQVFQAITDGVLLTALLTVVWLRPRAPGVVACWFLIGYGALRFVTEQFREPDHNASGVGVLTLPMLLSLAMVVVGALLLVVVSRRNQPRIGGLLKPSTLGAPRTG